MRKCPASPVPSALVSCHVPDLALLPDAAAAIQSDWRFMVASTLPLSAVATSAGGDPVRILSTADVPIAVSIASRRALRTAVESLIAIFVYSYLRVQNHRYGAGDERPAAGGSHDAADRVADVALDGAQPAIGE